MDGLPVDEIVAQSGDEQDDRHVRTEPIFEVLLFADEAEAFAGFLREVSLLTRFQLRRDPLSPDLPGGRIPKLKKSVDARVERAGRLEAQADRKQASAEKVDTPLADDL